MTDELAGKGWVLVPVEPTEAMLAAYHGALRGLINSPGYAGLRLLADGRVGGIHINGTAKATARFQAMLAAAPPPPDSLAKDREIERLRNGWQSIETAPKDGTRILCICKQGEVK